jgi:hypothetical protein
VLEWLDATGLAVWLRESPSIWSHATVLTLHTTGLAVLVGASWVLDLRLLGISRNIPLSAFRWVFAAVWIGLSVNLVTGVLLFIKNATTWGTSLPFLIKMCIVIAGTCTLLPIRKHVLSGGATRDDVSSLPTVALGAEARRARYLAIASIVAWSGAVTAGRLLAYLQP